MKARKQEAGMRLPAIFMKRYCILLMLVLLLAICGCAEAPPPELIEVELITIEFYNSSNEKNVFSLISEKAHIDFIVKTLNGANSTETGACPLDIRISLQTSEGKAYQYFLAADGCNLIHYGMKDSEEAYELPAESFQEFKSIIADALYAVSPDPYFLKWKETDYS